jgi:hypothetical protein
LVSKQKIKILNLELERIDLNTLLNIADKVEKGIRRFLDEKLPPKSEHDLIISITHEGDHITLSIDVGVKAGYADLINYDKIVGDAINIARRIFEREIKKYRRIQEIHSQKQ